MATTAAFQIIPINTSIRLDRPIADAIRRTTTSQWVRNNAVFQELQRFSSHPSVFVAHLKIAQVRMEPEHRRTFHTDNTIRTSTKMHWNS
jgi:hypothetical protein